MKFFVLMATVVLGATIALTACKATDSSGNSNGSVAQTTPIVETAAPLPAASVRPPQQQQGDGVRRISVADARAALDKGEALMLDVRLKNEYDTGHIKGSRSMPKGEILARADELPKDKLIIAYCA